MRYANIKIPSPVQLAVTGEEERTSDDEFRYFGPHEYIRDVTRRLAKLGALSVAPNYYYRKGDLTKISEIPQLVPLMNPKSGAELFSDLDSTVAWVKAQGAAHNSALKAGVAFYGSPVDSPNPLWPKSPTQLAPHMKAPVLGLYGEANQGIPVAQVEALKAALASAKKTASSRSIPARRTASTPTIVQAPTRKRRTMRGFRRRHGSRNTRYSANKVFC